MFRAAASGLAKRAIVRSSQPSASSGSFRVNVMAPRLAYHASPRWEDEEKKTTLALDGGASVTVPSNPPSTTNNLAWFGLPLGLFIGMPLLAWDVYVINAETQLMMCQLFVAVAMYTQLGDAVAKTFDDDRDNMEREHAQIDDELIAELNEKLTLLRSLTGVSEGASALAKINEEAVDKMNIIGTNKPKHELKAQVERALSLIQQEEINVKERTKAALMAEALSTVSNRFSTSKDLRKASLDSAVARIKGTASKDDPVHSAFVAFFKEKATSKVDDSAEVKAQRETLINKLNSLADNDEFYFKFDKASAKPVLTFK